MECSVIISSSNRAAALKKTLHAFGEVCIPSGWSAELIVVDNASKDNTADVVRAVQLDNFKVHYLHESRVGKSHALNTGMAAAQGEALLFTDDDIVPEKDWLEKIATPLLQHKYEGVIGRTRLASHLLRDWMKPEHKLWLVAPDEPGEGELELIGANMGLHRSVFQRIEGFDPELGPGASGFGEETLLTWQMSEAGLRLGLVSEAVVVHHPDISRLLRSQWLAMARKRGRTAAYILHHWRHIELKRPFARLYYIGIKLGLRRLIQSLPPMEGEGSPPWEMSYVTEIEMCRQFIKERKRPRNYPRHGLQKKTMDNVSGIRTFMEDKYPPEKPKPRAFQ
jgi:glycosyltransferase involved in cell wall biosynthesis